MILVGTVHGDLEGPHRLELLLNHFRPKVISLESPASVTVAEAVRKTLAGRELMAKVSRSLKVPSFIIDYFCDVAKISGYELIAPAIYAKDSGALLYPVDHPQRAGDFDLFADEAKVVSALTDTAAFFIQEFERKGGSVASLSKVSYFDRRPLIVRAQNEMYETGRVESSMQLEALLTKQLGEVSQRMSDASFAEEREQFMTAQLLQFLPEMHVGGLQHTHQLQESGLVVPLYERLGKAVTQAIKLCDVEALVKATQ